MEKTSNASQTANRNETIAQTVGGNSKYSKKGMILIKTFKPLLLFLLIFYSAKVQAQRIILVDSITKAPLSFVAIEFEDSGFYSSISGEFDLKMVISDSLKIRLLGYKTKKYKTSTLKDTIFLQANSYQLDEVTLTRNQDKTKNIKFLKGAKSFGSWPLQPKSEIITSIKPSEEIKNHYVDKIIIPFSKVIEKKELKNKKIKAYVRIHIYNSINNNISESLYSSPPKDVNSFTKDIVTFDISDEMILLNENGIFIGLELIGYYLDSKAHERANSVIRPQLTSKTNDYFKSNSFLRFVFKNYEELVPLNEMINKENPSGKVMCRNLNIGLELSK
ncbi:hypothetical protein [Winogradskyella alexanderae]|uniref:Carboxypeptidase-like protein n=1 Tax=Winogradskyella alexanderae TaxID=2877123 RepID=A0ABS7XV33_9FLAO|nr:hypothetical protein [Winogradskyella alexanderae]MCA0133887.1 hypothetical protein [Winogradskyella alexanderae]